MSIHDARPEVLAVLFDYGLVLSGPPRPEAWEGLRTTMGLEEEEFHQLYWKYRDDYDRGTLSGTEYWQHIGADAGVSLSPQTIASLKHFDVELWTDTNASMVQWAAQLAAAGIRTGILSNIGDAMTEGIVSKFDWLEGFHHLVWSHALKMRKPEPEIYAAAAEGLGVPVESILFIDDREENIRAAEAAGMQGIIYRNHEDFEAQMKARGLEHLLRPENLFKTVSSS